ncbi:MAG: Gx transporter family protein [Clostridia bacterium]|nr:Gx transporter family protein [Clostridia bacterium]
MKASKLTLLALSVSLAMILSFVESQIPAMVAIPGVKVGLANIVVVFVLYKLGWKEAAVISLTRVFLVGLLFGNGISILYSITGAVVSFTAMVLLKQARVFSTMAVSVAGGVLHNLGQIVMACVIMGTDVLKYYAPFLILSGTLAGIAIGVLAAIMIRRIDLKA